MTETISTVTVTKEELIDDSGLKVKAFCEAAQLRYVDGNRQYPEDSIFAWWEPYRDACSIIGYSTIQVAKALIPVFKTILSAKSIEYRADKSKSPKTLDRMYVKFGAPLGTDWSKYGLNDDMRATL